MSDSEVTEVMTVPEAITIIVHGARGLQGRKSGRHKFSVIFGVGNKKYRTDVVKDPTGCPDFNEETIVPVVNPEDSVFFTVTEKDDILGQLAIPLSSLQSTKGRILRAVLLPHRKCPRPQGELIYQCYVSKYHTSPHVSQHDSFTSNESRGGFSKIKHSIATTPILPRKLRKNKRSDTQSISGPDKEHKLKPLSSLNKKFSKSLHDLINFAKGVSEVSDKDDNLRQFKAPSTNYMDEIGRLPAISAVTPSEAPTSGGTQLVIIGRHLGIELTDIISFTLCGCDLRDTLQYESTMRLFCTTKPWDEQTGSLEIETTSGGKTTIQNVFTFTAVNKSGTQRQISHTPSCNSLSTMSPSPSASSKSQTLPAGAMLPSGTPNTPSGAPSGARSASISTTPAGNKPPTAVVTPAVTVTPSSPKSNKNNSGLKLNTSKGVAISVNESSDSIQNGSISNGKTPVESPNKSNNKYKPKKDPRHFRHNSETAALALHRDQPNISDRIIAIDILPYMRWNNSELIAEVNRLEQENKALKLENLDMKAYIEKLVEKVMLHCPEALNNETES